MMRSALSTSLCIALLGCGQGDIQPVSPAPLRQLTPTEYNHAVRDLLGMPLAGPWPAPDSPDELAELHELRLDTEYTTALWPWPLPPEVGVHGYEGFAAGQTPSPYRTEQLNRAAGTLAMYIHGSPSFFICGDGRLQGAEPDERAECARSSVERFANRAFRRPLADDERTRLLDFHANNVEAHGLYGGTELTVQGILQAPQFLYVPEFGKQDTGANIPLDGFEMATRLSLFLWDSIPDPKLFEAASKDKLTTRAQVLKQARRMLKDPRARTASVHFHNQWLELDKVHAALPDQATYQDSFPNLVPEEFDEEDQDLEEIWSSALIGIREAQLREAELFIEDTVFDGPGTLDALLTSTTGFVSEITAFEGSVQTHALYNPASVGKRVEDRHYTDGNIDFVRTTFEAEFPAEQRAGILTLGATLTSRAHPVHPAPILRGVFLLERIGCQPMGQPPDGAAGQAPPDTLDPSSTNRERIAAVTADPMCAACHDAINPLGFALEHYDALGAWRAKDGDHPVDASGTLRLVGEEPLSFNGPVQLAQHLANSPSVQQCYAEQWIHYALGRTETESERSQVDDLVVNFQKDRKIRSLILDIVSSDLFRYRHATGGN